MGGFFIFQIYNLFYKNNLLDPIRIRKLYISFSMFFLLKNIINFNKIYFNKKIIIKTK